MNLRSRGLNGDKCLKCCERQRDLTELNLRGFLGSLLSRLLEIGTTAPEDSVLAWVPVIRPPFIYPPGGPRIFPIERGRPLPKGAVILIGTILLALFVVRQALISTLTSVINNLDFILPNDCDRCVKAGLWNQDNLQITVPCPNGTKSTRKP